MIESVSVGMGHTIAKSKLGYVYSWGIIVLVKHFLKMLRILVHLGKYSFKKRR